MCLILLVSIDSDYSFFTLQRYSKSIVPSYGRFKIALDYGKGSRVFDKDGFSYIDLGGGIAVNT